MLDPAVFKAYDVRGIYPDELDEEGGYAIGRAYVEQFEPRRIAVGRDMRVSGPAMAKAVAEGAADAGADVAELGMVGTEMVYFAVGDLGLDGGIAVTASHNPREYTGMKIVRRGALPVGGESGLMEIRDRAAGGFGAAAAARGAVEPVDIWPAYVDRVIELSDIARPGMLDKRLNCGLIESCEVLSVARDVLPQKMVSQRRYVIASVAQRRKVYLDRVQPE